MTSHLLRLWVIGSYEMPRCDWLQHCNFLAGIEILPIALQTACKPCGFAAGRPAIVAGPVLRVAIGESCSVCRALKRTQLLTLRYSKERDPPQPCNQPKRRQPLRAWFHCKIQHRALPTTAMHSALRPFLTEPEHVLPNKHHKQPLILN